MSFDLEIVRQPVDSTACPAWEQECHEIARELHALCPALTQHGDSDVELTDGANGIQMYLFADGSASLSVAGWGDWFTRANEIRAYLDVFEKRGFQAYDPQGETHWTPAMSSEDISKYLAQYALPPRT